MDPLLVPPTPTPMPPAPPAPIVIDVSQWRIWNFVDEAVMVWQQITPARTQVFQVAILVAIIIIAVVAFISLFQGLSE
jgi:hypothetical protein